MHYVCNLRLPLNDFLGALIFNCK